MLFEKLSEFINGKIFFTVNDGFDSLFLQQCKNSRIKLFNIKKEGNYLSGWVKYKDIKKVMASAQKSGMEFSVTERSGMPYIYYRYRKRFGIPIGLLLATLIIAILTSMIWSVEINGEISIPEESIVNILEENGVSKGKFADALQCRDIEFLLYSEIEKLSWVSVYIAGSRVFVEIKERPETQEIEDKDYYSNIVAAKDGEIVRADIYQGDGKIYPGTAVVKGDMLVNGVVTLRDERVKFIRSKADIYARTYTHINSSAAKVINASKIIKNMNRYSLYFFGLNFPKYKNIDNSYQSENKYLFKSSDIIFPVGVVRNNCIIVESAEINLTDKQALLIAFFDFSKASMKLYKTAEILERDINLCVDSQITIESKYLCIENIAEEKRFAVASDNS